MESKIKLLKIVFWVGAALLGAIHAFAYRHAMNTDGISYLDIADAYFRGDWKTAINAYWSPLYSWLLGLGITLLKPTPYWEFSVVHLMNFLIYLFALSCFEFFLRLICREWVWIFFGYALFIWTSLTMIEMAMVTPDLCVAGIVYLVSGILLRIRRGSISYWTFFALGIVLGLGYLAKAAMFPLAFVFLGVGALLVGDFKRAIPRFFIALFAFGMVSGPFIFALSKWKGSFTFSESGKMHYAWLVSGVPQDYYRFSETPQYGLPKYPVRKIFDKPAAYEFGTPIQGTFPPAYDPAYWFEGIEPRFNLKGQTVKLVESAKRFYYWIFDLQGFLALGLLVLFCLSYRDVTWMKDVAKQWPLILPALAAFGMYSLLRPEIRYLAPFFVIFWIGLFSSVRLPLPGEVNRIISPVLLAVSTMLCIFILFSSERETTLTVRDLIKGEKSSPHIHWQVANELKRMGIQEGDKVASIGWGIRAFWARLARVRIVAEIFDREAPDFWMANDSVKSEVIRALVKTGAKVIVADHFPNYVPANGWQKIGDTNYYAYLLNR